MKYRVSPEARQALLDIYDFISRENQSAADRVIDTIKEQFRSIAQYPDHGRSREELSTGLRSLVVRKDRSYIIFYQQQADAIDIIRVLDGARDLKRLFQR